MKNQVISHQGVVKTIEGEHVRVSILQASACSGCAARQMCSSAEAKVKEVDILAPDAHRYRVGQEVMLEGRLSDGRMAAMIGYGIPLLLLILVLLVSVHLTNDERWAALWALLSVAFYYAFVYLFLRQRLQQRFSFQLHPLEDA